MAWLGSGMALAMMAARVMALLALVMLSLAPALLVLPALGLALALPPLALPALVLAGTRARRLEQKRRQPYEASGLVRGWQQLPRLQGAVAARRRDSHWRCVGSRRVVLAICVRASPSPCCW